MPEDGMLCLRFEIDAAAHSLCCIRIGERGKYERTGSAYELKPGGYRGDSIGVYTYNNHAADRKGYIDIRYFRFGRDNLQKGGNSESETE
jgi:hypothetical protein